jgi:hypothetical protein
LLCEGGENWLHPRLGWLVLGEACDPRFVGEACPIARCGEDCERFALLFGGA